MNEEFAIIDWGGGAYIGGLYIDIPFGTGESPVGSAIEPGGAIVAIKYPMATLSTASEEL